MPKPMWFFLRPKIGQFVEEFDARPTDMIVLTTGRRPWHLFVLRAAQGCYEKRPPNYWNKVLDYWETRGELFAFTEITFVPWLKKSWKNAVFSGVSPWPYENMWEWPFYFVCFVRDLGSKLRKKTKDVPPEPNTLFEKWPSCRIFVRLWKANPPNVVFLVLFNQGTKFLSRKVLALAEIIS